ncbi:hypothetical protein AVEN_77377-1 [Araneus ventricosus]|uniref:Uncharacterized protein n=1 Tax=Araneus ventricosus TaxID=182803 RepID=A0A4Y2C820_ARAVE|nr:hypothetical protein AVEN_77377-1 [Araneus ventricosus]
MQSIKGLVQSSSEIDTVHQCHEQIPNTPGISDPFPLELLVDYQEKIPSAISRVIVLEKTKLFFEVWVLLAGQMGSERVGIESVYWAAAGKSQKCFHNTRLNIPFCLNLRSK